MATIQHAAKNYANYAIIIIDNRTTYLIKTRIGRSISSDMYV